MVDEAMSVIYAQMKLFANKATQPKIYFVCMYNVYYVTG